MRPRFSRSLLAPVLAAALFGSVQAGTDPSGASGPLKVSFQVLAGYHLPEAVFNAKPGHVLGFVPRPVRALDGREVALTGFMLPIRVHNRLVTSFMLMRTQNTCCFGIPPELHEVVEVLKMDEPSRILMDTPVTVVGHLHVRERWEGTFLCSIYQLDAERVAAD